MRRRDFFAGCLIGYTMAASACLGRKSAGLQKLRLAAGRGLTMSSLHLAHELGYFRDSGFELEILHLSNPIDAMTLLAGGKMDVAFIGLVSSFLNISLRKLPVKIVAGREVASPLVEIWALFMDYAGIFQEDLIIRPCLKANASLPVRQLDLPTLHWTLSWKAPA